MEGRTSSELRIPAVNGMLQFCRRAYSVPKVTGAELPLEPLSEPMPTIDPCAHRVAPHQPSISGKLCRCRVRLRAFYLALGLEPIVQIVTVSSSALLVAFVGTLLNPGLAESGLFSG
jgi:hypothetical protein